MVGTHVTGKMTEAFLLQVALGNVQGYASDFIIAVQSDLDTGDGTITIWDNKFDYTPFTGDTEMFLSSSNDNDDTVVRVIGLDTNFEKKTVDLALTGQTQVSLGIFRHVQIAIILGPTTPAGNVYVAATDTLSAGVPTDNTTVKSTIIAGQNMTHNGFYMIPKGKAMVVPAVQASTDTSDKHVAIGNWITALGGQPMNLVTYTAMAGFLQYTFPVPFNTLSSLGLLSEKTFLNFKGLASSNDTQIFYGLDLILVDIALTNLT